MKYMRTTKLIEALSDDLDLKVAWARRKKKLNKVSGDDMKWPRTFLW